MFPNQRVAPEWDRQRYPQGIYTSQPGGERPTWRCLSEGDSVCSEVSLPAPYVSCVHTFCLSKLLGPSKVWIVPPAQTVLLLGAALSELTVSMLGRSRYKAEPNISWALL